MPRTKCLSTVPKPGCKCNEGFVENSKQRCVLIEDCTEDEVDCPSNTLYGLSHHPRTCKDVLTNNLNYKKGCFCKSPKVYNEISHQCVAPDKCPFYNENQNCIKNDQNSVFEQCASGTNITCENPNGPKTKDCRRRCVCKEGYIYENKSKNPICIPGDQCPVPVCLKKHTIFQNICSLKPTCDNPYPHWNPKECKPGCFCKPGYVLNAFGNCIMKRYCPGVTCPSNQTYSALSQVCRKTCENQYLKLAYACQAKPGCDCNPGYVDDGQGRCILPKDCDPTVVKCPPNMHYEFHGGIETCNGWIYYFVPQYGCICNKNLILDDVTNQCIPRSKCPKKPNCSQAKNETYLECSNCKPSCNNYYLNIKYKCNCKPGCACQEGYIKNSKNQCIAIEDCPKEETSCQSNQEFLYNQKRKTCEYPNGTGVKTSGCFCKDGLLYNAQDKSCYTLKQCLELQNKQCELEDANSVFAYEHRCELPCSEPRGECKPGCVCKKGYTRNHSWTCVPTSKCPNYCGRNATYTTGYINCAQTCALYNLSPFIRCIGIPGPGCECNPGYVKNNLGDCVDLEDCPPEEVGCPSETHYDQAYAPRTCDDLIKDTYSLHKGCFCDDPLVYDESKFQCVYPEQCSFEEQNNECKKIDRNSKFALCQTSTNITCEDPYGPTFKDCRNRCVCEEGYIYESETNLVCVPKDKCPAVVQCPKNMHYESQYTSYETCSGWTDYYLGESGCICNEGLVLNDNLECVPKTACPKKPDCSRKGNQTYTYCSNCKHNCGNYYLGIMFKCPCIPGCACIDNYIKNSKDECVAIEDCQEEETFCRDDQEFRYNEELKTCAFPTGTGITTSRCFCKDGLLFDEEFHNCYTPEECQEIQNQRCEAEDINSEFSLNPKCERYCQEPIGECKPGCVCKNGYTRNFNWECVPISQCVNYCGFNASYSDGYNNCGQTCDTYYRRPLILCAAVLETGCKCDEGFVKTRAGDCVKIEDCPADEIQCPLSTNYEESYRHRTCNDLIDNLYKLNKGCFCAEGYVFDETTNECVLPSKCNFEEQNNKCKELDANSIFTPCASSSNLTCENPNDMATADCVQRCICREGYIYQSRDNLECIPKHKCPVEKKCPKNSHYESTTFSIETCDGIDYLSEGISGCVCNEDFVYDDFKNCVPKKECHKFKESDESDISSCPWDQEFYTKKIRKTCANPNGNGKKTTGCFCVDDEFVYNAETKTCIDPRECPESKENAYCKQIKPNSVFRTCEPGVIETCSGNIFNAGVCDEGCYCKPGYKLDKNENCVKHCEYYPY